MKNIIAILLMLFCSIIYGQNHTKRVLFIGNSYTSVNNLPKMIADVSNSTNDNLIYKCCTPPGYALKDHSSDTATLNRIAEGNWDYVVLQEQSLLPSLQISQVQKNVFPYAQKLNTIINTCNPSSETIFFMTWGRKNGDKSECASWPPVCTYEGMDSLLNLRYRMMADSNDAIISPVGAVWHYIRQNFPLIELYREDGSHPSIAGSYAAACTFYTIIFKKNPIHISFNSALTVADAKKIRTSVKLIVFDKLKDWNVGLQDTIVQDVYLK
jgi:hypothetical protein